MEGAKEEGAEDGGDDCGEDEEGGEIRIYFSDPSPHRLDNQFELWNKVLCSGVSSQNNKR